MLKQMIFDLFLIKNVLIGIKTLDITDIILKKLDVILEPKV